MTELIKREIEDQIIQGISPNKVIQILGPRRVGKTVLLKQIIGRIQEKYLLLNGEDLDVAQLLANRSIQHYKNLFGSTKLIIIDEAQKIPEIGKILKLMVDGLDGIKIIITGSSAFDLSQNTGEPLTGRKKTFHLFALSESELNQVENRFQKPTNLRERLVFGNYPELQQLLNQNEKIDYLKELVQSYLLKDILQFENIRNSDKILKLLRLIAFQSGNEISYTELGKQLSMSKNTIERYLDLLSKVYVIHSLGGFSKNLRKEISKSKKWYFFDNGLMNALIGNFKPIDLRDDNGKLWENYIISERLKHQNYSRMVVYNHFWRTYDQQEIDWIEEHGGKLNAFEFKWNPKRKAKPPVAWKNAYPDAQFEVIHPENYLSWITKQ